MKNETVFDVNIWLHYFISGKTYKILEMIENNDVCFYRSEEMMSELKDVINRAKFAKYFPNGTKEYILFFERFSELFFTQAIFNQCPDPKDNYLFDLAYQSHSNFLVSGDKKVLATPVKQSLKLCSLSEFKADIGVIE
jgi:putative PIN family toxin of toxin-antitoxin system